MWRPLFSFKYVLQGNLYNAASSVHFQVCFARQYIQCGDLCAVSSMFCKAIYTLRRPCSVSNMFCKAIYTMWRPLFSFKYILQGNLYNVATSVQFQVCFARQSIQSGDPVQFQVCFARQSIQCGDLCSISSIYCKAIYTMRQLLFSFKYVLQGNLYTYNAATSIQFQVCFAKQSIQCGDLCSVSSMFCKAISTLRRPLFSFKNVLQGNLYNGATSVQVQVCFAKQSIQCGDLCSSSSMFCKAIYTMRQHLFSSSMFLQGNLCKAATSVQFQEYFARQSIQCGDLCSVQVCFARRSIQKGDLCSVSSIFCKAIYTMRRPLFSFKYVLQGNLYNVATSVQFRYVLQGNLYNTATSLQFQVCFARQYIHCGDLGSVSSMFCKAICTMWRPLFCFKYDLQGNQYNAANSVQFQVRFARQSIQCGDLC